MKKISFLLGLLLITCVLPAQKTCVSGNCVNGNGRIRIASAENREFEGSFENGVIKGKAMVYNKDGSLWYSGELKNFKPHGEGIRYEKNDAGLEYASEEGHFEDNLLRSGVVFEQSGAASTRQILTDGEYVYDPVRRQKMGYRRIIYRGKTSYLNCTDMLDADGKGNSKLEGKVMIRNGNPSPGNNWVSISTYVNGKRDGRAREWDYENDVCHYVFYQNGKLNDSAVIKSISDEKILAVHVRYAAQKGEEFIPDIAFGDFVIDQVHAKSLYNIIGEGTIQKFKDLYSGKLVENPFNYTIDKNGTVRQKTAEELSRKLNYSGSASGGAAAPEYSLSDMKELSAFSKEVNQYYADAEAIVRSTSRRNYDQKSKRFDELRAVILRDITYMIANYQGKAPKNVINQIETAKRYIEREYVMPAWATFPR